MSEQVDPALEAAPAEEYVGPAVVSAFSTTHDAGSSPDIAVEVQLRGHFEPLDGLFHWYGRVAANATLDDRVQSGATITLSTPRGSAEGRLSDLDTWGRFRVTGTGRPPF